MDSSTKKPSLQERMKMLEILAQQNRYSSSNEVKPVTSYQQMEPEVRQQEPVYQPEPVQAHTSYEAPQQRFEEAEPSRTTSASESLSDYFRTIGLSETLSTPSSESAAGGFSLDALLSDPEPEKIVKTFDSFGEEMNAPLDPFAEFEDPKRDEILADIYAEELAFLVDNENLSEQPIVTAPAYTPTEGSIPSESQQSSELSDTLDYLWSDEAESRLAPAVEEEPQQPAEIPQYEAAIPHQEDDFPEYVNDSKGEEYGEGYGDAYHGQFGSEHNEEFETAYEDQIPEQNLSQQTYSSLLTYAFDIQRSRIIQQKSIELDCRPEDIIITALDYYLDALAAEDAA